MTLTVSKQGELFEVDDKDIPGSPPVGRGRTIKEAMGDFLWNNQRKFGVLFKFDKSAEPTYRRQRRREMAKR